jgi:PEP-CTERM motif
MKKIAIAMTFASATLFATVANAALVTDVSGLSSPQVTVTDFGLHNTNVNSFNALIPGSYNINMSYTGNDGLYFDYNGWGLGSNGSASGPSVGINQQGTLRFDFLGGSVAGVGFLMNYAPISYGPVSLIAYDSNNNILEQYELNADAPITTNEFQFRGIQLASANIASFELTSSGNPSPIFQSMTFTAAVPEPETYAMLLAGLGLMGAVARRRALQK